MWSLLAVLPALGATPRSVDADDVARAVSPGNGVTLVHVWATWCPACRAAYPEVNDLAASGGPRGLRVVALSIDDDPATVGRYQDRDPPSWTSLHVREGGQPLAEAIADLGGRWTGAVPYDLLLDADGKAVDHWAGLPSDLEARVARHLPEHAIGGATLTPTAAERAAVQQGTVRLVHAGREGAAVWIDGWQAGVLPLETELVAGDHTFRVGGDGEPVEVQRTVDFASGSPTLDLTAGE